MWTSQYVQPIHTMTHYYVCIPLLLFQWSCANDSSSWAPLPANSTEVTMDSHFDEDNNLESQVMFGHLENTLAVRCLARNEMAAVSREIKLVSSGKNTHTSCEAAFIFTKLKWRLLLFPLNLLSLLTLSVSQALSVLCSRLAGCCQCCSSCQLMSSGATI